MITEEKYRQYIRDFNAACDGDGSGFGAVFDTWYEPGATFEYMPSAIRNVGKDATVSFWKKVHGIMHERIGDHTWFLASETAFAVQTPIDFRCKQDLEWAGVKSTKGTSFRSLVAVFYDVSANDTFRYVRVYSIYNPAYQLKHNAA